MQLPKKRVVGKTNCWQDALETFDNLHGGLLCQQPLVVTEEYAPTYHQ